LLIRRALAEPPTAQQRPAVLQELGEAEALDHDPSAVEHLREALELTIDPVARVRTACVLGELLIWTGGDAVGAHAMLTSVLEQLGGEAPVQLRVALETIRAATASVDARLVALLEPRLPGLRSLADQAGPQGRALKIFDACWQAQRGPYDAAWRELLDDGLDGGRFVADHTGGTPIVVYAAMVLILADEVGRAELLLAQVRADARARGSIGAHLIDLAWGAYLALRRGDLETAAIDARNALELAQRLQAMWIVTWMMGCLADALRELGRLDQAAAAIGGAPIERARGTSAALHALIARASIRLAQGDRAGAIDDLRRAEENVIVNNPSFAPWRSRLAVALAPDDLEQALALAQVELERARELGQPRGLGVALRTYGVITGGAAGVPLLEEAVQVLRGSPAVLELGAALCELGAAWRRTGRRAIAREPLREALMIAEGCGAQLLAQRAREELQATGARLRRHHVSGPDSLTPSERRVAELAASGYANREIAQALFITTKTVGTHLAHIYQKLGLQGQQARDLLSERMRPADDRVTTA
jgi:DNA-binding CsgD family transcriptional regulator